MTDKPTKLTGALTRIHVDTDADAVNAGMAGMGFERVDDTKCPKCGEHTFEWRCRSEVWDCSSCGASLTPREALRQIATLTRELNEFCQGVPPNDYRTLVRELAEASRERDKSQAACAVALSLLGKLHHHMEYWGSQEDGIPEAMYADWQAANTLATAPNPAQAAKETPDV